MDKLLFVDTYQQFHVHIRYEDRLFEKYCTVPIHWTFKDLEKYLRLLFYKDTFVILRYSKHPVFLFNKKTATLENEDEYSIGLHWRDGIQWEIDMNIDQENIAVIIVTESLISEKVLFDKLNDTYPSSRDISTVYKTECWIKNNNYFL